MMKDDERYNAIKAVGQKKQIFSDYIQQLKRKDREESRVKKQNAKENFMRMLDSSGILKPESKYYRTSHFFQGDPRWRILDEKEREELFQDYLDELEKRDIEKAKNQRRQHKKVLRKILEDREDIDSTTRWSTACRLLQNVPAFNELDKKDRLAVFSRYVTETEKAILDAKKIERRTRERKNREAFRQLLDEHTKAGTLTAMTHWRPFVHMIKDDPRYQNLAGQVGSTPKELFDDMVNKEKESLKEYKDMMLEALKGIELRYDTSFDEVLEKAGDKISGIPEEKKHLVFRIIHDDVIDEYKEVQRKKKKAVRRFEDFLRSYPNFSSATKLEDIAPVLADNTAKFRRLSPGTVRHIFDKYSDRVREEEASLEIEPGEIRKRPKKDKHKDKKSKKHKRSDSHKKHKKKHKHSSRSPVSIT